MSVSRSFSAAALFALALSSCSQRADRAASPEAVAVTAGRAAFAADESSPAPPPSPSEPGAQGGVMLAYSYSMGIEAPKETIAPMLEAHAKECLDAGTAVCQVLGSAVNKYGEDQVSAYLNLRAEPQWLAAFRASIPTDAEGAGGEVVSNTVSTEDLTAYIIDVGARLEQKEALRDRIKALLESREGTLSDALQAERALAEVQGEIDSMTASLEAAKARVAMSALNVSYQSDPETSSSMFKPLVEAFGDFGRTSMASLAEAVNFVARAWPFFILILFALWVLRAWVRGWRGRRAKT
jgi:hypothetical protein